VGEGSLRSNVSKCHVVVGPKRDQKLFEWPPTTEMFICKMINEGS
jgi:hypothetical protein